MLSQFDSQYRVNLTLNIESIWLSISSQFDSQYRVNLTLNIESIWLSISSQFDSQYRVNLTQIFSNYSESRVKFSFSPWLNFLGQNDSIFLSVFLAGNGLNIWLEAKDTILLPGNRNSILWRTTLHMLSLSLSLTWRKLVLETSALQLTSTLPFNAQEDTGVPFNRNFNCCEGNVCLDTG